MYTHNKEIINSLPIIWKEANNIEYVKDSFNLYILPS